MSAPRRLAGPRCFLGLPAPAKLNLFLHVLGRRPDGYHEIESVFVPLDLCDTVDMEMRTDGRIVREGDLTGPQEADLAVRAARALQEHAASAQGHAALAGVTLRVQKRIPVGAGLGGGSSDAATTLIGLNRLWNLGLGRPALAGLARGLGADVPFFLGGGAAFVKGIGEQCQPLDLPQAWYVLVYPQVHVSTAEIFSDPKLTRDGKQTTIAGFSAALHRHGLVAGVRADPAADAAAKSPACEAAIAAAPKAAVSNAAGDCTGKAAGADTVAANLPVAERALFGRNDLESVVRSRFAPVDQALHLLDQCGGPGSAARMSGSGSAVFRVLAGAGPAQTLLQAVRARMPAGWSAWAVAGLPALPLAQW